MQAAFNRDQRVALLRGGLLVDDHAPYAVTLMYRSWPPVNAREHHAVQPNIGEITIGDQACNKASHCPVVGSALNWQGQPQLQLQLASSSPAIRHLICVVSLIFSLPLSRQISSLGFHRLLWGFGCFVAYRPVEGFLRVASNIRVAGHRKGLWSKGRLATPQMDASPDSGSMRN